MSSDGPADTRADLDRFKANSKLFSIMDEAGISRMAKVAQNAVFRPSSVIIKEGERGNTFYLIVQGGVRVMTEGLDEPKEVARLAAGQFFGEMAVLNDEPRTASVMAIGETRCLAFEKEAVLAILQDYPKIRQVLGLVGLKRAEQLIDAQLK
jgi:CRP-like cAMP-binding protein